MKNIIASFPPASGLLSSVKSSPLSGARNSPAPPPPTNSAWTAPASTDFTATSSIATACASPQRPDALTQLGAALHFSGVSLRYARTPNAAAPAAQREKRSVLRPAPRCPWWPYIWSRRTALKVGPDGRVPIGHERLRVGASAGTRVIHCLQPTGTITILAHPPKAGERPALLLQIRAA